ALGGAMTVTPDATEIECQPGDTFLLCSDGLTGMVPEDDILRVITHEESLEAAGRALVEEANSRGGHDNITAVLVRVAP
ncbi:MAG TPA: SpoIIE family protein phosphatase, partial [Thermoanaerobaculia bacterium]